MKELLPSAVKEVGDVSCSDGEKIHNFLMVDKVISSLLLSSRLCWVYFGSNMQWNSFRSKVIAKGGILKNNLVKEADKMPSNQLNNARNIHLSTSQPKVGLLFKATNVLMNVSSFFQLINRLFYKMRTWDVVFMFNPKVQNQTMFIMKQSKY